MKKLWLTTLVLTGVVCTSLAATLIPNDFDNDGKTDYVSFNDDTGVWDFIKGSDTNTVQWGFTGVVPVTGDFDGDGTNDFGCYNASEQKWYITFASDPDTNAVAEFGTANSYPVVNDFNGDGVTDLGTYSNGFWFLRLSATNESEIDTTDFQWGFEGSYPATGHFDNDGIVDYAVYESASAIWFFKTSAEGEYMIKYGLGDTLPVIMDVDGDGIDDYGCYYPPNGKWMVSMSSKPGYSWETMYGFVGTIPFCGTFDSDDITDFGVYHFGGIWYTYSSENGHTVNIGTQLSELPIGANQFNYNIITSNSLAIYNDFATQAADENSDTNSVSIAPITDVPEELVSSPDEFAGLEPPPLPTE